jgi:hypothetical protein
MVLTPFFPFRNSPSQRYSPYSSASIYVKSSSPDLEYFDLLGSANGRTTIAQTANTRHLVFVRTATSLLSVFAALAVNSSALPNLPQSGKYSRSRVIAKSAGSENTDFISMDAIFKLKKGSWSLVLTYYSIPRPRLNHHLVTLSL